MGTRADFYVGRGLEAKWLGSIAWDGYPSGIDLTSTKVGMFGIHEHSAFPKGQHLFDAATEGQFRARLEEFFTNRDDVTLPKDGWPWPWDDSHTTDYAYAFDDGKVWACPFGHGWFDPHVEEEPDFPEHKTAIFPNMKSVQRVTLGNRSGVIVVASASEEKPKPQENK